MNKMSLMVCPHDTAGDSDKWFHFAQYVSKRCDIRTKLNLCLDFVEFHEKMSESDIIYANPQDSLVLLQEFNYVPIIHSTNLFDEIVFVANNDTKHDSISDINSQRCVSCNNMMVTRIGIQALFNKQLSPSEIHSKDNWMAVVKSVYKGEYPYGFVYKDFYDGLNSLSKSCVNKLGETAERSIYHSVFIKNEHKHKADKISQVLTEAHLDEKGKEVLSQINVEQFVSTNKQEIDSFKSLLDIGSELIC